MVLVTLSLLKEWGVYRPQTSLNFELKTVNSENSGVWRLAPPDWGGCTAWQSSETEPLGDATACQGRLHLLPELGDRAQAVPPLDWDGCTAQPELGD